MNIKANMKVKLCVLNAAKAGSALILCSNSSCAHMHPFNKAVHLIPPSATASYLHLQSCPPLQGLPGLLYSHSEQRRVDLLLLPWWTPQGHSLWTLAGRWAGAGAYARPRADETYRYSHQWGSTEPFCAQLLPGIFKNFFYSTALFQRPGQIKTFPIWDTEPLIHTSTHWPCHNKALQTSGSCKRPLQLPVWAWCLPLGLIWTLGEYCWSPQEPRKEWNKEIRH